MNKNKAPPKILGAYRPSLEKLRSKYTNSGMADPKFVKTLGMFIVSRKPSKMLKDIPNETFGLYDKDKKAIRDLRAFLYSYVLLCQKHQLTNDQMLFLLGSEYR